MLEFASQLDRKRVPWDPARVVSQLRPLDTMCWGRNRRWIGIVLDDDLLVLDFKQMSSFRIRLRNLTRVQYPLEIYRIDTSCAVDYVRTFFQENCDNPYALWSFYRHIATGDSPPFTQLPPLAGAKDAVEHSRRISQMSELAKCGDNVFTYDRSSGLHKLIRRYDRGMFGHCAIISERKTIYEITVSGGSESPFSDLDNPSLDVGLYRVPDITEEQRHAIAAYASKYVGRRGYGWYKVIRLMLWKRFHIPYDRTEYEVSPEDLIHIGKMELICYA